MTLAHAVQRTSPLFVWRANRDSTVGLVSIFAPDLFNIRILNKKMKDLLVPTTVLNREWLAAPRIDIKWLNVGSVWVVRGSVSTRRDVHAWEITGLHNSGFVQLKNCTKDPKLQRTGTIQVHSFMHLYVRLWGHERFPAEPKPYLVRKTSPRPKREPKSAIDRLLEDEPLV